MADRLTYADFKKTGWQDCKNACERDFFDLDSGTTPEQIVDAAMVDWDDGMDEWVAQMPLEDYEGLDPKEAFRQWTAGWRAGAIEYIRGLIVDRLDDMELWYLQDNNEDLVENFDELDVALKVLASLEDGGMLLIGDGHGPEEDYAWTDPASDELVVADRVRSKPTRAQRTEFSRARAEARARNWRPNPENPWQVRTAAGGVDEFSDEHDAKFHADELRRAGSKGVTVDFHSRRRPVQRPELQTRGMGLPPGVPSYSRNPLPTKAAAEKQFYELLIDPDPAGMEIAQDLALENNLSLADLGEGTYRQSWAPPRSARGLDIASVGYFRLSPSFSVGMGPSRGVMWSIEKPNLHRMYLYTWGTNSAPIYPGAYTRTLAEGRRVAAADCWAIAKALKSIPDEASWSEVQTIVQTAYAGPDKTPSELYEHRSTKKRTYAEAQDAALGALQRAGWAPSRGLKIPYATSPNGRVRLWFKPQAVYATVADRRSGGPDLNRHVFKDARSISYGLFGHGLPDMRSMSGSEFVAKINELYAKALR